jgi:hypothetical protein
MLISGEETMAADKKSTPQDLLVTIEKALRRGKKLEKTLLRIVAQSEPSSEVESLLKSVQQGLKILKKEAKKVQHPLASNTKKVPAQRKPAPVAKTQPENSSVPVRPSRKTKSSKADVSSGKVAPLPDTGR